MGTYIGHIYIITICVFFLWVAFGWAIWRAYKKLVWDPYTRTRREKFEARRRLADRRG